MDVTSLIRPCCRVVQTSAYTFDSFSKNPEYEIETDQANPRNLQLRFHVSVFTFAQSLGFFRRIVDDDLASHSVMKAASDVVGTGF